MKYPSKDEKIELMGKRCLISGSLYRDIQDKKHNPKVTWIHSPFKKCIKYPKYEPYKKEGWIIGFGFVFDGVICSGYYGESNYFKHSVRKNVVFVRLTPDGKIIKVLPKYVSLVKENNVLKNK